MKAVFEESTDNSGPHLSVAELIAYQKGALDELKYKLAQSHLVACAQCISAFKDVDDFYAPAVDGEIDTDEFEVRRQWHAFKRRFPLSDPFVAGNAVNEVKSNTPAIRLFLAAAAGVLLAVGVSSAWIVKYKMENEALARKVQTEHSELQASVGRLQDENRRIGEDLQSSETKVKGLQEQLTKERKQRLAASSDAAQPLINTQSFELSPDSVSRSNGNENSRPNKLAPGSFANSFHLIFMVNSLNKANYSMYALDIFDLQGRRIRKRETGLAPDQAKFNRFSLTIPRAQLKEGEYKLSLLGDTSSGWRRIAVYKLTISR